MSSSQDRDIRIRAMWEAGNSLREIALALDIEMESVRSATRKFEDVGAPSSRRRKFLENIQKADDLDKKWKVSYLIQALGLKTITQNALIHHLEWHKIPQVSLRQIMNLAIPEIEHPKPGYLITRLLDVRCVGVEGFWSVADRLAKSDLGQKCNEEWKRRLARLRQS